MTSEIFEKIAINGDWNTENDSISGSGSSIYANKYRVIFIGEFIKKYNIKYVYDICGDCNWQHTIPGLDKICYIGTDISQKALCEAKKKNNLFKYMSFTDKPLDLTQKFFNVVDGNNSIIIVKEVIQHLSFDLALKMLKNIKNSGIKYIAITNHDDKLFNITKNYDIENGSFYENNIFFNPFNFKNPIMDINDELDDEIKKGYGNLIIFNIQEQLI